MSSGGEPRGHFAAYRNALKALSARTGTPLPSLVVSFGVLHELTAIVPLVGVFYGARMLGVGERVVDVITQDGSGAAPDWARGYLRTWVDEGDKWAAKVGARYGVFGYEKRAPGEEPALRPGHIAGDVANAVVAYGVTKALIPLRVGLSLYLSPAFSRRIVEPFRKTILQAFRRG